MTARAYSRGWAIYRYGNRWFYEDNDEPVDEKRPCKRCSKKPTSEGFDACMGRIPGAVSVCCGHGVTDPIILPWKNNEFVEARTTGVV